MQYILTEEEKQNLVSIDDLLLAQARVRMLTKAYRDSCACKKDINMGYCDDCPIGGLNNGLTPYTQLCPHEEYSK